MPWEERSFMVETKPQAEYSSLYVACVENDPRDIVRIVQNGIDLCSSYDIGDPEQITDLVVEKLGDLHFNIDIDDPNSPQNDLCSPLAEKKSSSPKSCQKESDVINGKHRPENSNESTSVNKSTNNNNDHTGNGSKTSLCALIKGMRLDPESVKNYSWTEDQQTFACKLKLDLVDKYNGELRTWNDAIKSVRNSSAGLETYCKCLDDCDVVLRCNKCSQILHRDSQLKSLKYYKLPSVEFNEIIDELFCHQHEHGIVDNNIMYSYFVNGPKLDQCFVGSLYLLLNPELVDNCLISDSDTIVCKNCRQNIGCLDKAPSNRYFPKKNAYRFYHIVTNLLGRSLHDLPQDSIEQNFFRIRYENQEQYFSWLLLTECESYSTLYFVIKTLDFHPKLMIWILDAFTVMALGKLCEVPTNDVTKFSPFPAVKLLYKKLNDENLSDPFVNGQHTGVATLYLPQEACEMLLGFLEVSCLEMPDACRTLGNFRVGFLPTATEF